MTQGEKTTSQEMGEALKERRQALRMSQEAVASQMGCSSSHLSRIERGVAGLDVDLGERLRNFYTQQEKNRRGLSELGQTALGVYLTRLRKERGGVPGVSTQYLRNLETGRRYPSLEVLKKIATCYRVPLQELLDILDGPPAPQEEPKEKEGIPLTTENMRHLREQARMSLSDVAGLIGVSASYLSKAERGIAKLQPGAMRNAADLFGCSLEEEEEAPKKSESLSAPSEEAMGGLWLYMDIVEMKGELPRGKDKKLLMELSMTLMKNCAIGGDYRPALLRLVAYGLKTLDPEGE